jgi:quinol monooxygenase YgiN
MIIAGSGQMGFQPFFKPHTISPFKKSNDAKEAAAMLKSIVALTIAIALAITGSLLMTMRNHEAAAQSGPLLINAANLDIVPGNMDKFLAALRENGAAAVTEPGCREFNIMVAQNDPNHVFIFAVFDSAGALEAHRTTDAYKQFQAATKGMVAKNEVRQFLSVSMHWKGI